MTRCCSSEVKVCRHHLYYAALLLWCHHGRKPFFGFTQWVLPKTCAYVVPFPCRKWVSELHQTACLKCVILASTGMLRASRETVSIPICFPTLTAHHQSNKALSSFHNIQCGLSEHIVNAQHLYVCMTLPAVAHTVHMCLFMFLTAASGREREKESDGSQCLVFSQWLGCLRGDVHTHSLPGSAAWFRWPKGGLVNNSQLY